jgi:hypothetical protein
MEAIDAVRKSLIEAVAKRESVVDPAQVDANEEHIHALAEVVAQLSDEEVNGEPVSALIELIRAEDEVYARQSQ